MLTLRTLLFYALPDSAQELGGSSMARVLGSHQSNNTIKSPLPLGAAPELMQWRIAMPSHKNVLIALLLLTSLALCTACGDNEKRTTKSESTKIQEQATNPDLKAFSCPVFSFLHSKKMTIKTQEKNGILIITMSAEKGIRCGINAFSSSYPSHKFQAESINGFSEKLKSMGFKQPSDGFEEVQRTIGGQKIKGKMLKFQMRSMIFNAEFYVYPTESQNLYFVFFAPANEHKLAESYFKTISDSIQVNNLLKYNSKALSFLYSSDMKLTEKKINTDTAIIIKGNGRIIFSVNIVNNPKSTQQEILDGTCALFINSMRQNDVHDCEVKNVHHLIGGRQQAGKIVRCQASRDPVQLAFFSHEKENSIITLTLAAPVEEFKRAESRFNIILDSIK